MYQDLQSFSDYRSTELVSQIEAWDHSNERDQQSALRRFKNLGISLIR